MGSKPKYQAVFLDRDGTIIKDVDHLTKVEQIEILPGVAEVIHRVNRAHIPVYILSNQSVVGLGLITLEELRVLGDTLTNMLMMHEAFIDASFWCTHTPEQNCFCRKPKPGLLYVAAVKFQLDLRRCILIGDRLSDIQAAKAANCQRFKVSTERGLADWKEFRDTSIQ